MKRTEMIKLIVEEIHKNITQPSDLEAIEETVNTVLTLAEQNGMRSPLPFGGWEPEDE